ncbi:hypothetical protein NL676_009901 [Syzygium grande]|nr:hypothetical protein NL676_009901 [Syzygium grande]
METLHSNTSVSSTSPPRRTHPPGSGKDPQPITKHPTPSSTARRIRTAKKPLKKEGGIRVSIGLLLLAEKTGSDSKPSNRRLLREMGVVFVERGRRREQLLVRSKGASSSHKRLNLEFRQIFEGKKATKKVYLSICTFPPAFGLSALSWTDHRHLGKAIPKRSV